MTVNQPPAASLNHTPPTPDGLAAREARDAAQISEATGAHLVPVHTPTGARRWVSYGGLSLGALVLGGLSAAFVFFPIDWHAIGRWGYLGIFAVVLVATASVAVPIPYLLIVARAGTFLNPFLLALVGGLAGTLGEMAGYLIGAGGNKLIPHGGWYARAHSWIERYGFWCIALFACVPNPFFDAVGLAAGTLGYSWWKFVLACFLGKSIKFLAAALIGAEAAEHGWLR